MKITRREFLQISGSAAAGTLFMGGLGFDLSAAQTYAETLRIKGAKETTTICCYCSVGCGIIVHTQAGRVINAEGDPEHPINEGALYAKGASLSQMVNNPSRLQKPLYRAPKSAEWQEVDWEWALDRIARHVKDTRDRTFKTHTTTKVREVKAAIPDESGTPGEIVTDVERQFVVNRAEGMAHVGSAALDNEECYLVQKLVRSWGLVHVEHQARL